MTVLLPPIILIPGVGGSKLDAVNKKNDKVERVWISKDVLPVPQLGKNLCIICGAGRIPRRNYTPVILKSMPKRE